MSEHVARLEKMAQLSRSRRNMDKIRDELDNLEELRNSLEPWLEAAQEVGEYVTAMIEKFYEIDANFLAEGAHDAFELMATGFERYVPEDGGELATFVESFDGVREGLDELESMLDDRDYGAEDRDEKWYEALDFVQNMANALAQLESLGVPPKVLDEEEN